MIVAILVMTPMAQMTGVPQRPIRNMAKSATKNFTSYSELSERFNNAPTMRMIFDVGMEVEIIQLAG